MIKKKFYNLKIGDHLGWFENPDESGDIWIGIIIDNKHYYKDNETCFTLKFIYSNYADNQNNFILSPDSYDNIEWNYITEKHANKYYKLVVFE